MNAVATGPGSAVLLAAPAASLAAVRQPRGIGDAFLRPLRPLAAPEPVTEPVE